MTRLSLTRRLALAGVAWMALGAAAQAQDAAAIHQRALVLDSHVDVLPPGTILRYFDKDGTSHTSLAKLKAGGVDAVVYAVAVSTGPRTPEGYAAARKDADVRLAEIQAMPAESKGEIAIAYTADDVRKIVAAGKVAVIIGFQNAHSLGGDLANFDHFYEGGVRVAALNHAGNTVFADSSRPQAGAGEENGGLSALGKAAVSRFNDLGVLIDVSQLTKAAVLQTIALSRAPVVATHSSVFAISPDPRNLSDEELDAIKANGGVVQLTPFNRYLVPKPADYEDNVRALRRKYGLDDTKLGYGGSEKFAEADRVAFLTAFDNLYPQATVKDFVDHIDYVVKRIGVDHVGVGTDFNHGSGINGFHNAADAPAVTAELVKRGYSEADIDKIWSGNFLRALAAAQAAKK
ncbi:dipeptidase [Phenylobacterium immobile]|uniref:dipeptidase n=1 Tax=Phenylobacterium immobile TaxID=21 RepID=UPI000AB9B2AA|nr:membrane dipeptidase [Phenylobacterium immobile]